ncbi:phosphatase PAP2 family protein [Cellulomonas sp.]|uniref:phosphatase PAP2 family protein n=1 Tax=Cellulomonas sp. TaxID=40001 RepID=UPI002811A22B|nr:phosphatase PAP2 family protein [Cellulomonas sp.]
MSEPLTPAPARPAHAPGRDPAARWRLLAVAGLAVLVASYAGLVLTTTGQALENAALRGADQLDARSVAEADDGLHTITLVSLGVACAVVALVGLLRRSWPLAAAAVGSVVAGQVVTQGLKRYVLPRPALVEASADYTGNSFPSGHTTIALTVLAAALLVATWRARGVVLLVVAPWAVGIAGYTLAAKWHRLSDTLGAAGVTLVVASLAALWLHRRGLVRTVDGAARRARVVLVAVPLAAVLVVSGGLGAFLLAAAPALLDRSAESDWVAFLALQSIAAAGSAATVLALWWGWHRLEVVPRPGADAEPAG